MASAKIMRCPNCGQVLAREMDDHGIFWNCEACEGQALSLGFLRHTVVADTLNKLWQDARSSPERKFRKCPPCGSRMTEVSLDLEGSIVCIDVCTHCQFIWLDKNELRMLPKIPPKPFREPDIPLEARQALGILHAQQIAMEAKRKEMEERGESEIPSIMNFLAILLRLFFF